MAATTSDTIISSTFSEEKWAVQTRKILENEIPSDENIPIAVCHVPNSISVINPEAYAPQVISLGPYHYLRPELYHMERYKIEMVKSYWRPDQINLVVNKLNEIGPNIRACYHKHLDLDDDTLALMLAIDGLFLIYLLSKPLNNFTDNASVFSDVMMLENQIPMFVLKEIVNSIGLSNKDDAKLFSMMQIFCKSQSPFQLPSYQQALQEKNVLHLLDLLHKMIIMHESTNGATMGQADLQTPPPAASTQVQLSRRTSIKLEVDPDNDQLIQNAKEILASEVLSSIKPIRLIKSLPWGMISNLLAKNSGLQEVATTNPLVKEINVPSVSKLSKRAQIIFKPANQGTLKACFDHMTATLYIPVITLNGNSEVVLRNLVAYEMASSSSTLGYQNHLLGQYVDFMSGIIDTKEDARLLRVAGIIKGNLTDVQVADLFNGMNKSSMEIYDDTVARTNAYYSQRWKVKANRFVKKYVYESWRFLTVISMLVLLLLMILQSVCSIYECKQALKW
ncbi:hypothetical protein L2E82_39135 [Cichorium intybus]|uniref:Uncharacterized protein n=1 Tax=Cichorium intybus TaxID=13427 RepID=A0ACB9AIC0_CICIN|nr:hypothetical protein L2E82_39135 [Cichorium intybus]